MFWTAGSTRAVRLLPSGTIHLPSLPTLPTMSNNTMVKTVTMEVLRVPWTLWPRARTNAEVGSTPCLPSHPPCSTVQRTSTALRLALCWTGKGKKCPSPKAMGLILGVISIKRVQMLCVGISWECAHLGLTVALIRAWCVPQTSVSSMCCIMLQNGGSCNGKAHNRKEGRLRAERSFTKRRSYWYALDVEILLLFLGGVVSWIAGYSVDSWLWLLRAISTLAATTSNSPSPILNPS
mmetsp:Transcript_33265/g.61269  ORF Transcript_33265/g.61269 Transcript_33265/m.61269 type:complete len:236 (+) Transcript_33265:2129-2836(+)